MRSGTVPEAISLVRFGWGGGERSERIEVSNNGAERDPFGRNRERLGRRVARRVTA